MSSSNAKMAAEIAGRCRRVGWPVEVATTRGQSWKYRITLPDSSRVQIHGSPSDPNWFQVVLRDLEAGGFAEAEAAAREAEDARRKSRLAEDRRRGELAAQRAAERADNVRRAAGPYVPQLANLDWFLWSAPTPETRQVIVTPEVAAAVLDAINVRNRRLRPSKVDALAAAIRAGHWACTHQGGAIDRDGVLQDGQHRLAAICAAGIAVPMMWSVGMPPDNYTRVDTGLLRSGADMVYARSDTDGKPPKYVTATAATAKMIYLYQRHGPDARHMWRQTPVSNVVVADTLDQYGDRIADAVSIAGRIRADLRSTSHSGLATAVYFIKDALPDDDPRVNAFIDQCATGADLRPGDPVYALRRLFIRNIARLDQWIVLAYTLKAWKAHAMGATVAHFQVSTGDKIPAVYLPPPLAPATADLVGAAR